MMLYFSQLFLSSSPAPSPISVFSIKRKYWALKMKNGFMKQPCKIFLTGWGSSDAAIDIGYSYFGKRKWIRHILICYQAFFKCTDVVKIIDVTHQTK